MLRRSLLTAGAGLSSLIAMPRLGWAPPSPKKGVWAVKFDGTQYLEDNGNQPNMPASPDPVVLISYYYNATVSPGIAGATIFQHTNPSGFSNSIALSHQVFNNQIIANLGIFDITGQNTFYTWIGPLPYNATRQHVIVSLNAVTASAVWMLNGVSQAPHIAITGNGQSVDWSYKTRVGGVAGGSQKNPVAYPFQGSLAEFVIFAGGSFMDPSDPAVLAGFYDTQTGMPPENASNGSSFVAGRSPQIYLSGPPSRFADNYAQATWNAETSVAQLNGAFAVPVGALKVPATDPWGFSGV